jgi:LysR family pca operon transcriptional activator
LRSIRAADKSAGQLKVGALPSVASSLLPKSALDFAKEHPETLLEVHEGPHHDLISRLRSGGLDLVVGRLGRPETMAGLVFQQLYTEEVVIVARPDSPALAARDFAALDEYRVLYPPKDSAIRSLMARLLISKGIPLFRNRIESTSPVFGRAVVMEDAKTVWFISRGVVATDLAQGRLVKLNIDTSATAGAVGIMSRAEEVSSVAARAFERTLVRICEHQGALVQGSLGHNHH